MPGASMRIVSFMKLSTFRILFNAAFDHPSVATTASISSRRGLRNCGLAAKLYSVKVKLYGKSRSKITVACDVEKGEELP